MRKLSSSTRRARTVGLAGLLVLLALFSGHSVSHGASTAGERSASLPYIFAHRYLPALVHEDPQIATSLAFSKRQQELLLKIWELCQESYPDAPSQSPTDLTVTGGKLDEGVAAALVTMPSPEDMTEAYYVCVIARFIIEGDKVKASDVAYYTLEKSISLDASALFGLEKKASPQLEEARPTVLGGWTKDGSHLNFGSGPSPDSPEDFVKAVYGLYRDSHNKDRQGDKPAPGQ